MKTTHIAALCCTLSCASAGAQTGPAEYLASLMFPTPPVAEQAMPPVPLRPDPVREFIRTLRELAVAPDHARLKTLYWTGADETAISESMVQMERILAHSTSFALKDFARLSDAAKAFWQRKVKRFTSYEASGVLFVIRNGNGHVDTMFPLQISNDGIRIVPPDHSHRND